MPITKSNRGPTVSSITDMLKKKQSPTPTEHIAVPVDSANAATLALDNVETIQPPEEPTVLVPRNASTEPAATEPASTQAAPAAETPTVSAPLTPSQPASLARDASASLRAAPAAVRSLIGSDPARQQRLLAIALGLIVLLLLLVAGSAILRADRLAQQVAATGQSLMQSQRLAKSVSQALVGSVPAFAEVKESSDDLLRRVQRPGQR